MIDVEPILTASHAIKILMLCRSIPNIDQASKQRAMAILCSALYAITADTSNIHGSGEQSVRAVFCSSLCRHGQLQTQKTLKYRDHSWDGRVEIESRLLIYCSLRSLRKQQTSRVTTTLTTWVSNESIFLMLNWASLHATTCRWNSHVTLRCPDGCMNVSVIHRIISHFM